MKKSIIIIAVLTLLASCKDEVVPEPDRLIEKEEMVNIMYDLSILEAIKYQNPASLDTFKINPRAYIFKKYKIDSLQFAENNVYYASDYEGYKLMFEDIRRLFLSAPSSVNTFQIWTQVSMFLFSSPASNSMISIVRSVSR